MRSRRRVSAVLEGATPAEAGGPCGVHLVFRPARGGVDLDRIEDFADLGPEHTVESALGLAKLVRLLRAARVAPPGDPRELLGDAEGAARLLERARGASVLLGLRPRARVLFTAWTEQGVHRVEDVSDVEDDGRDYLVRRCRGRPPVRVPRASVVRQRTDCETWFEVTAIERP